MKISIITCTWNSVRFLPDSITSVLSQDYPHIEYIFVDGGSDDGTIELIKAIPRPVVFVTGIRGGISAAMNKGIELATGDVIAHLHSDDYYLHARVITRAAEVLEGNSADWCFGRAMNNVDGNVGPENWKVPFYSYRRLLKGNFIPHPATFIRKRVFVRHGLFDIAYRFAMDYDMWLRIGKKAAPVQVDEHWSVIRRHAGSMTSANLMESLRDDFSVRLSHMRKTPWDFAYHYIHFLVRRQRLRVHLSQGSM